MVGHMIDDVWSEQEQPVTDQDLTHMCPIVIKMKMCEEWLETKSMTEYWSRSCGQQCVGGESVWTCFCDVCLGSHQPHPGPLRSWSISPILVEQQQQQEAAAASPPDLLHLTAVQGDFCFFTPNGWCHYDVIHLRDQSGAFFVRVWIVFTSCWCFLCQRLNPVEGSFTTFLNKTLQLLSEAFDQISWPSSANGDGLVVIAWLKH